MSDTLEFLNLFKIGVALAMLLFLLFFGRKPWSAYILLGMAISMGILNVIQLILEIQLERFFFISIFSILIWVLDSILIINQLIRRKRLKKFIKQCEELQKSLEEMHSRLNNLPDS